MAKLILLDRDGVINFDSPDYIKSPDEWRAIPGSLEAIAMLKQAGRLVAVCTNQAGIARGLLKLEDLSAIHDKMLRALGALGASVDLVRFCPHHPDDNCPCRKPRAGMLRDALAALGVSAAEACFVGDSEKDLLAARAVQCRSVLVRTGNGEETLRALEPPLPEVFEDLHAFAVAETGTRP